VVDDGGGRPNTTYEWWPVTIEGLRR